MYRSQVLICGGTGCTSSGSVKIAKRLQEEIDKNGLTDEVMVVRTGCFGLCALGPIMIVYPEGTFYSMVRKKILLKSFRSICSRDVSLHVLYTMKQSQKTR